MRSFRSPSPPPRSPSPELFVTPLPSPRRKRPRLDFGKRTGSLRSAKSEGCLSVPNKLELPLDEFGSQDLRSRLSSAGQNSVVFPKSEMPPSPTRRGRGHRRSGPITYPSSPRSPPRTRSPPPTLHTSSASRSPPPPLPPLPSFVLSLAHKATDDIGLQHIYIPDIEFNYSLASPKTRSFASYANSVPPPLTHLQFFAVHNPSQSSLASD